MRLFGDAGIRLRPYPIDDGLQRRETVTGSGTRQQQVQLSASAYCTDTLRHVRLVSIEGGSSLQVLNFCAFPSLEYDLPSFAADLVSLPGGHLIAIDFAPNRRALADSDAFATDGPLAAAFERHRPMLPDGGSLPDAAAQYFSPYLLWSRLPTEADDKIRAAALPAFEDYLRVYLDLVRAATPLDDPSARADVTTSQRSYIRYRADEDPARPMLTRLFGEDYAETLIREVLFMPVP